MEEETTENSPSPEHISYPEPLSIHNPALKSFILGITGFCVCACLAFFAEVGLILLINAASQSNFYPRGSGWFIFPVVAGTAGGRWFTRIKWRNAPTTFRRLLTKTQQTFQDSNRALQKTERATRYYIVGLILWLGVSTLYAVINDDINGSWRFKWDVYLQILFIPVIFVALAVRLINWARKAPN